MKLNQQKQTGFRFSPDVLIIESNSRGSGAINLLLKRENYKTHAVCDGLAAAQYIKYRNPTSMVVLDADLPQIDTYNVMKQIRVNKKWKDVPVVFLSNKATEEDVMKCRDHGANDYILKSLLATELLARVSRYLKLAT